MTMVEVEPKATKIRWSDAERIQVLREAANLAVKYPTLVPLQLVRMAQAVLPEERRRVIQSLAMANWAWFTDVLPGEIEQVRKAEDVAESPSLAPEPPASEPDPGLDLGILGAAKERVDELLLATLEQSRIERAEMFDRFDARIEAMEAALGRIADALCGGFALTPLGRAMAPAAAPAPPVAAPAHGVNGRPAPAVLEAPGTGFAPVRIPAPPPKATRKPNVVVFSVGSGHTAHGIRLELKGYAGALLDFKETTEKVEYDRYDYVVLTKDTPLAWIAEARQKPWKDKIRQAPGTAKKIARFIRGLPEIEV